MDLATVCRSFPGVPKPEIWRESAIDTIERLFIHGNQVVVIEGENLTGKTVLLTQFVRTHPNNAISLFLKPTRLAHDPDVMRYDLCNQLEWLLKRQELRSIQDATPLRLRDHLMSLQKLARREPFYFVVDGLCSTTPYVDQLILDMLPINLRGFRFLFSADPEQLASYLQQETALKTHVLGPFSLAQTKEFLSDLDLTDDQIEAIHQSCGKLPGHLASARRNLLEGIDPSIIVSNSDWLEIEWQAVDESNKTEQLILALLAFGQRTYSIEEIARIASTQATTVESICQGLRVIRLDSHLHPQYEADSLRGYAQRRLASLKSEVEERITDDLQSDPTSNESLTYLPTWYTQTGKLNSLLEYLSPDNFVRSLELHQSMVPVERNTELGIAAARDLRRHGDMVRLTLQNSTLRGISNADVWRSEVQARMAVDDYQSAMALAQSVLLKEDRLHLLAVIARFKRQQGLEPEAELQDQIKQLYTQIDPRVLGKGAMDVAIDLLFSHPDLAIDLVERATADGYVKSESRNVLEELSKALEIDREGMHSLDDLRKRTKDPEVVRFSMATTLMVGDCPAREIIDMVKDERPKDQLYFLTNWALRNREAEDAYRVVSSAFRLAIDLSPEEYIPARDFRRMASPLPNIRDDSQKKELVQAFDGQLALIERLGPTEDYIRLQILLARAESCYNPALAEDRVIETYLYTFDITDLIVQATCLAHIANALPLIDPDHAFSDQELPSQVDCELKQIVDQLLGSTAAQYRASRRIIKALVPNKTRFAFDQIALRLNTERRRYLALDDLAKTIIGLPLDDMEFDYIDQILDSIRDHDIADDLVVSVLLRFSDEPDLNKQMVVQMLPIVNRIESISDSRLKCQACTLGYTLIAGYGEFEGLSEKLLRLLDRSWLAINSLWERIDIGFRITSALAPSSLSKARTYLQQTEELRATTTLDTETTASIYIECVLLTVRAFSGLLQQRLDNEDDWGVLKELIDYIPSTLVRLRLWSRVAQHFDVCDRTAEARRVVDEHIQPLLQDLASTSPELKTEAVVSVAPSLYAAHPTSARQQISNLPESDRNIAAARTATYLMRKVPLGDPYRPPPGKRAQADTETVAEMAELMLLLEHDSLIYAFISTLSENITVLGTKLSGEQRHYYAKMVEQLIADKLPDSKNITHEGYVIISKAELASIRRARIGEWLPLIDGAKGLKNAADRAFVLAVVASTLPKRETSRRHALINDAFEAIAEIPFALDRITRYESLAAITRNIDQDFAKKCITSGISTQDGECSDDYTQVYRRLVDLAYTIDEDFAESLAEQLDDDPARKKSAIEKQLYTLRLRKEMANQEASLDNADYDTQRACSQVAWMLLGALNGGSIGTVHIDSSYALMQMASELPLTESYPMLAWVIENAKIRYTDTDQAQTILRPIFEAATRSTQLARYMTARTSDQLDLARLFNRPSPANATDIFRAGDRGKVLSRLRDWFEQNVEEYLKICDPYFGPEQLEILLLLKSTKPDCRVEVLTSQEHHREVAAPWSQSYRDYWRSNVSQDQDPPDTYIVILGTGSGKLPIHERWWLTKGGGLRMGPFSHLGITRTSEISLLTPDEAALREAEVDQYITRSTTDYNGKRLKREAFTL